MSLFEENPRDVVITISVLEMRKQRFSEA